MAQKVAVNLWVRGRASPCNDWKTLSVNSAVPFSNKGGLRQRKERERAPPFISYAQETV